MEDKITELYLRIWEKLVDLHIFHDELRQERLKHFYPIQIALVGGVGLSIQQCLTQGELTGRIAFWIFALSLSFLGARFTRTMKSMNARAAEYVTTIKRQLHQIENFIVTRAPEVSPLPYQGQFRVLNQRSMLITDNGIYEEVPPAQRRLNLQTLPASTSEGFLINTLNWGWVFASISIAALGASLIFGNMTIS